VRVEALQAGQVPILVVEDSDEDVLIYERALEGTRYELVRVRSVSGAERVLASVMPATILLDIRLHGDDAWDYLAQLKRNPSTAHVPVVVLTTIDDRRKGIALGAHAYGVKPIDPRWLVRTLDTLTARRRALRVLTVDDEEATRFIIRQMLNDREHEVIEATTGGDGLSRAKDQSPDVILLDLRLTDMTGFDVVERLREDPSTAAVPVVVITSQRLDAEDRRRLSVADSVLSKATLTRDALRSAIARAVEPHDQHLA